MADRPPKPLSQKDKPSPDSGDEEMHWAGHGHVGAFLLQLGSLILVNLALWGFIFLMALRLLGEPMPWNW